MRFPRTLEARKKPGASDASNSQNLLGGHPILFWNGWATLLFSPKAGYRVPFLTLIPVSRGPGNRPDVPIDFFKLPKYRKTFAGGAFDFVEDKRERRRLVVQDNTDEGRVDVETFIAVFNEAEFPEFVHEKIHPRPRGPNHFREQLL
jgi:hypothetical protein